MERRLGLRSALTLQAADLGLEAAGLPSLLALRHAVQAEVDELVGMAPLKRFLQELRAKVEYVERGGDPRLLEGCLNIVLTGNPGAGKTTAARLLFRALRGYGLLRKEVFVERNALELKGTHIGWTCPQVKEMVQGPHLPISPHITPYHPISPHISPYLPISPHISPYLPISPHISP